MAELNISNLNKKSEKYIFKNKLNIRRKSKRRLLRESAFMLASSLILIYINYLIPEKKFLFEKFLANFEKSFIILSDLSSYLFQIALVLYILISMFISGTLLIGSVYRMIRVAKRKTRHTSYK